MRAIAGIIAGLIAGFAATILIGIVGVGATYSAPPGIEAGDARQVFEAFAEMPEGPKIALMLAWCGGGVFGAMVAKRIVRAAWAAWTVAALIAVYVVLNVLVLPLPGWMQALSVAAPLLGGLLANHLVAGRDLAAEAEAEAAAEAAPPVES